MGVLAATRFTKPVTDCAGLRKPMGPITPTLSTISPTGSWRMSPPLVSVAILELTKARSLRRRDKLPFFQGFLPHNNLELLADPPVFKGKRAYGIKDKFLPHMIGEVTESEVARTDILRSDILVAITLMKRQLRALNFRDHHTIPVSPTQPSRILFTSNPPLPAPSLTTPIPFAGPNPLNTTQHCCPHLSGSL